jgi:hypothetical protein
MLDPGIYFVSLGSVKSKSCALFYNCYNNAPRYRHNLFSIQSSRFFLLRSSYRTSHCNVHQSRGRVTYTIPFRKQTPVGVCSSMWFVSVAVWRFPCGWTRACLHQPQGSLLPIVLPLILILHTMNVSCFLVLRTTKCAISFPVTHSESFLMFG